MVKRSEKDTEWYWRLFWLATCKCTMHRSARCDPGDGGIVERDCRGGKRKQKKKRWQGWFPVFLVAGWVCTGLPGLLLLTDEVDDEDDDDR